MAPSNKTMLFVCLLVAAVAVVVPVAQGQLIGPTDAVVSIPGTLFCSANLTNNGTSPPLANATVQLRCGAGNGTVVASATTNNSGFFSIILNLQSLLSTLLGSILSSGCRVVVTTPIVGCNVTLPTAGSLSAPLTFVRGTISGLLGIVFNIILGVFAA